MSQYVDGFVMQVEERRQRLSEGEHGSITRQDVRVELEVSRHVLPLEQSPGVLGGLAVGPLLMVRRFGRRSQFGHIVASSLRRSFGVAHVVRESRAACGAGLRHRHTDILGCRLPATRDRYRYRHTKSRLSRRVPHVDLSTPPRADSPYRFSAEILSAINYANCLFLGSSLKPVNAR